MAYKKILVCAIIVVIISLVFLTFVNDAMSIETHNTGENSSSGMSNAIWVKAEDMHSIDFNKLKSAHIDTVFLNYGAIDTYGKDDVISWVGSANNNGINVHIWMQVLYQDGFQNPLNSNGDINQDLLNKDINDSREYASIPGIKGIVLDYIRYPGNASDYKGSSDAVSVFVNTLANNIREVNGNLIVSGTLMPEVSELVSSYGQDLNNLTDSLDYIIPMMYKGNYNQDSYWVETTTNHFVDDSGDAKVVVSLMAYKSDENINLIGSGELEDDIAEAYVGGANDVAIFRYGLTDFKDFDTTVHLNTLDIIRIRLSSIF